MSQDLKISNAELSIYCNKIMSYSSYIVHCIDMSIALLNKATENGIIDIKFREAVSELNTKLRGCSTVIASNVTEVNRRVNEFNSSIESADNYVYSDENMASVLSVLSMFI